VTDVRLFHTLDGGNIEFQNGQTAMSEGLETGAYLSMFGGNERDGGLDGTKHLQWWGNLIENDPAARYRSETQHLLRSLPAIPANLKRLEDAAKRDLAWFTEEIASSVEVTATMPKLNWVELHVEIMVSGKRLSLVFNESWRNS
jgi:phage gp46-like protein